MTQPGNVVQEAIDAAGGVTALATALGLKPPSIIKWRDNQRVPLKRVRDVSAATGIPKHRLCPEHWSDPEHAAA